jgi:NAD(P)-dependent dehydrogenase (short-subunit alcohol dehydrogenase family)
MDLELNDKVAVVTGAGKGIGLAATRALVAEGAEVIAGFRTAANLDGIEGVTGVALDLSASDGPGRLVQRAIDEYGRIDVLVNNVGAVADTSRRFLRNQRRGARIGDADEFLHRPARQPRRDHGDGREWRRGYRQGRFAVDAFFQPDAGTVDYGPPKAVLVNLPKTLSREFGSKGIRVNSISRGPVGTDFFGSESTGSPRPWRRPRGRCRYRPRADRRRHRRLRHRALHHAGGGGTLIVLLASERLGNVTGANYLIEGGLLKTT